ncbi:MAG: aldolase [Methanothrix sp.]|nr:aldolase [Methanothrix sp.]
MPLDWQDIASFGKKLVISGLTSSRFGNISLLRGDKISITCTGSMLDELDEVQVVEVDLSRSCDQDKVASSETCVHRAIYRSTTNKAVIHTHSPYAVALSILERKAVEPLDGEGMIFLGAMPIVEGHFGTDELAKAVSFALQNHKACIARGHGVFAAGNNLLDAYSAACMAEHSAQVRYLVKAYPGMFH